MDNVIIYDKLEELNEGIESNGGGITSLLGKGCVKSVQRGMLDRTGNGLAGDSEMSININQVDVSKSLLSVSAEGFLSNLGGPPPICFSLEPTKIALMNKDSRKANIAISWQVVEFY